MTYIEHLMENTIHAMKNVPEGEDFYDYVVNCIRSDFNFKECFGHESEEKQAQIAEDFYYAGYYVVFVYERHILGL